MFHESLMSPFFAVMVDLVTELTRHGVLQEELYDVDLVLICEAFVGPMGK